MSNDHCLIIDGHSFPALPLPYELNQTAFRPDFCLGTDDFHTSEELVARFEKILESCGYSTARDQPFSGTIVPMKHYRKDQRVQLLVIEINCWLYLGEDYSVDFKEGGGIGQCVGTSWEGYNEMGVRSSTNIEMLKLIKFIISFWNI